MVRTSGVLMSAKQQPRAFGADYRRTCQHCDGPMHLIRRGPDSDFGAGYERQTFLCSKCNVEIERSADKQGKPPEGTRATRVADGTF